MDANQPQSDPTDTAQIAREERKPTALVRPFGRLRSWLSRDPEPSVAEVMAQWAEYQLIFNDILTRLSAQLARQARMEKKRLERIARDVPDLIPPPAPQVSPKQALRSQYAMQRFGGRVQALLDAKDGNHESNGEGGPV